MASDSFAPDGPKSSGAHWRKAVCTSTASARASARAPAMSVIFLQIDQVLWLARGVPKQLKPPIASNNASVRMNEVLFALVRFSISLDEFRVSLCAWRAFLGD